MGCPASARAQGRQADGTASSRSARLSLFLTFQVYLDSALSHLLPATERYFPNAFPKSRAQLVALDSVQQTCSQVVGAGASGGAASRGTRGSGVSLPGCEATPDGERPGGDSATKEGLRRRSCLHARLELESERATFKGLSLTGGCKCKGASESHFFFLSRQRGQERRTEKEGGKEGGRQREKRRVLEA